MLHRDLRIIQVDGQEPDGLLLRCVYVDYFYTTSQEAYRINLVCRILSALHKVFEANLHGRLMLRCAGNHRIDGIDSQIPIFGFGVVG